MIEISEIGDMWRSCTGDRLVFHIYLLKSRFNTFFNFISAFQIVVKRGGTFSDGASVKTNVLILGHGFQFQFLR